MNNLCNMQLQRKSILGCLQYDTLFDNLLV